ncbi:hypothetical protein F5Y16DRAFT_421748 [Xylariaceae sp. FL0255]|nr:hypothetical protein F5Y16DRAFT_421748 [Xylariaceae sp. FL0255]
MIPSQVIVAALMLPGVASAAGVYDRPVAYVYAHSTAKALPQYTDEYLLTQFKKVERGITSLIPFMIKVVKPEQYAPFIKQLQALNITIIPAVGGPPANADLSSAESKAIAAGYKQFGDYIRFETGEGYVNEWGIPSIQAAIDNAVSLGFKHIMVNPWPLVNGKAAKLTGPVEASFDNVLDAPTQWYPSNQERIKLIRDENPNAEIVVNYESPGQQVELAKDGKAGGIADMTITVNKINREYKSENLHWAPPLGGSYDAFKIGTWDWIATTLSGQGSD